MVLNLALNAICLACLQMDIFFMKESLSSTFFLFSLVFVSLFPGSFYHFLIKINMRNLFCQSLVLSGPPNRRGEGLWGEGCLCVKRYDILINEVRGGAVVMQWIKMTTYLFLAVSYKGTRLFYKKLALRWYKTFRTISNRQNLIKKPKKAVLRTLPLCNSNPKNVPL